MVVLIRLVVLICLCINAVSLQANTASEKTILLIESYHDEYQWVKSYREGLFEVLGDCCRLHSFQMDTKRRPVEEFKQAADKAWRAYLDLQPDLVILSDDNALRLLGQRLGKTGTPVVFLGINNNPRLYKVEHYQNITGVLERPLYKRSIVYINSFTPLRKILILFDSGITSNTIFAEVFGGKAKSRVFDTEVHISKISSIEDWKAAVMQSGKLGYDAIFMGLYHNIRDTSNNVLEDSYVAKWTSKHSPVPVFGFWDFAIGSDAAAGGYVLFGKEQGVIAANMARDILFNGKSPKSIPSRFVNNGHLLFSTAQVKRWGISLPEDIRVLAKWTD